MDERDNFALYINYGGYFLKLDDLCVYVKGNSLRILELDCKRFDFRRLNDFVKFVGYASWSKLYFKYPMTHTFRPIEGDEQVKQMLSTLSSESRVVSVYVEGGVDDKSGRLEQRMKHQLPTFIANSDVMFDDEEGGDREASVSEDDGLDIGGIDRADNDGLVTQLESEGEERLESEHPFDIFTDWADNEFGENADNEFGDGASDGAVTDIGEGASDGALTDISGDGTQNVDEQDEQDDGLEDEDLENQDPEYLDARKKARETKDEELERLMQEFVLPQINEEDLSESEYEDSDGDLNSDETDEDDDFVKRKRAKVVYDPNCDHKNLQLVLGMRFQDGLQCRQAITTFSIENGKFVRFRKVSKTQCFAKCKLPCEWKVYASVVRRDKTFCIKTYYGDHTCPRSMNNKLLSSKWIAMRYLNVFRNRPLFSVTDLRQDINDRWGYDLPKDRLYKARVIGTELLRGTVEHHYGLLRRYTAELRRTDPEGRFELLLDDDNVFKGLYIGFSSLVKGFKASCRPIIGLDGCHLKTYLGGVLLCAIAKDGNDQMYPICWAVVEVENQDCWSWFLKCFIADIGIGDGNGYSFISDQQKGLENAVKELAPYVEHRNCSRHIYMNWKKEHKGSTLKNLFLYATRSTWEEKLKGHLLEMQKESMDAYHDFMSRDIKKFCKAYISTSVCSDMIDNNISETFNGWILKARGKHVIHMCEEIRCSLMVRQVKKRNEIMKVTDRICPNIRKELEISRRKSSECYPIPNLDNKFEVGHFENKFVVDVGLRTCSCREWNITGIPCVHGLSAIHFMGRDPTDYVHEYYTVEKYLKGYEHSLQPINGEKLWPQVSGEKVRPPALKRQPGRPKKKRMRSAAEKEPRNPNKLSRGGMVMNCRRCGGAGHNKTKCQNMTLPKPPPKPKGKPGRPAKQPSADSQGTTSQTAAAADGSGARGRGGRGIAPATRGRGAGRGRATFQAPRSAPGGRAHLMRERNYARGGGVYVGATGNIYYSAPGSRVVNQVHSRNRRSDGASSSRQHSTVEQSISSQQSVNGAGNATSK